MTLSGRCIKNPNVEGCGKQDAELRSTYGYGKCGEEEREMRHGITWVGAIVVLFNFTASQAENARQDDPVEDEIVFGGLDCRVAKMTLWGLWQATRSWWAAAEQSTLTRRQCAK